MDFSWLSRQDLALLSQFATALAIGLLIGLERERHPNSKAGLRTFAIVAMVGAASAAIANAMASPVLIAAGVCAVAATLIGAYFYEPATPDAERGTTTIAAAILCYLLAVMVQSGWLHLSVILGITTTALLYFKSELGGFARALTRRDLISILQFALVAFIVLPLLPDIDVGPYEALNPRHIWWMVVLISGVSLAGYVALRLGAGRMGSVLIGLLGGLVSSTATTLAYSRLGKKGGGFATLGITVILTANLMVLIRLLVFALLSAPVMLPTLLPVLGAGFIAGVAVFAFQARHQDQAAPIELPHLANPAELGAALAFAALYGLMLVLSAWASSYIGTEGVYGIAAVSGLFDVDAITLSSFRLVDIGTLSARQAGIAVALALCMNILFKLGVVWFTGGAALFRRCLPGLAAVPIGLAAGIALMA
jgi:uncharacterized membrane protein (DUF4010 family)